MKKFMLVLLTLGLIAGVIAFGDKLAWVSLMLWLIVIGFCVVTAFVIWLWRVITRALDGSRKNLNHAHTPQRSAPARQQPRKELDAMTTEKKPIPPKKVAMIAAGAFLLLFACGGTWAAQNAVTILLIAAPVGVFFALRYYTKASEAALYAALAIAGGEVLFWLFGGFDAMYRRVAMLGGELQCLSTLVLIGAGLWVLNKKTNFIGRALDEAGVDTKATAEDLRKAVKETADQAHEWLKK